MNPNNVKKSKDGFFVVQRYNGYEWSIIHNSPMGYEEARKTLFSNKKKDREYETPHKYKVIPVFLR